MSVTKTVMIGGTLTTSDLIDPVVPVLNAIGRDFAGGEKTMSLEDIVQMLDLLTDKVIADFSGQAQSTVPMLRAVSAGSLALAAQALWTAFLAEKSVQALSAAESGHAQTASVH